MKIEKVNDHQIRCTLTKEDLADREIKISELAYGTEKAKNLFRDMMQQASFECGFEAEDIPLMIEAIPLSDCIVLVITKVEDPEELDTRFSKFAPSVHSSDSSDEDIPETFNGADDILDIFRKIQENREAAKASKGVTSQGDSPVYHEKTEPSDSKKEDVPNVSLAPSVTITKIYAFENLDEIIRLSHVLNGFYEGPNDLYKDSSNSRYLLMLGQGTHSPESFNKICNVSSEYGRENSHSSASESFLKEHCSLIIKENALQSLKEM